METHSIVSDWVKDLDIADGLKQLLIDAGFTIESVIRLGYRDLSEMLHIDPYVSKLIVEAAQNNMQEKESMSDNHTSYFNAEKRTVMICDDDEDLLNLFGKALKPKYNTILVSSGEDCIDKFIKENNQGNKIHLILLDYKLGDMLGDSVARKIKEYNGVKIILISAYDLDDPLIKELQENNYISKCIEKPVHLSNLMETIADTIS